jgi:TonB family protein
MPIASVFLIASVVATPLPSGVVVAGSMSDNDYPTRARKQGIQGSVVTSVTVDTKGRVANCAIADSSGSDDLDQATCGIIKKRFRFKKPMPSDVGELPTYSWKWSWRLSDPCPKATAPNDVCIRIERR